jgi:probable HAF family extracellular repeat protein
MKSQLGSLILSFATAFALTFFLSSTVSGQAPYTGGAIAADVCCAAGHAINAYGDITGAYGAGPYIHAFLYTSSSGIIDLGTLGGHLSFPEAINASDEVTGYSTVDPSDLTSHAFLYTGGRMIDLGTLGGSFQCGVWHQRLG